MGPARSQPTEAEWLEHKAIIRRLYLIEEMPLKKLVAELGGLGLVVSDAQVEYKLKQWEFRRNIDKATWIIIDRKIAKRKQEGKESQVIHCGKRLKQSTIDKETNRHRDIATGNQPLSPLPTTPAETHLVVCTPPPLAMEFTWPSTLPWFKFQRTQFSPLLSNAPEMRSSEEDSSQLLEAADSRSLLSSILASDSQLEWTHPRPEISRLAALIGKSMPESYPEEHLQRAQALLDGSSYEVIDECLAIVIYNLSNNLSSLFDNEKWNATTNVLRECGILNLQANLREVPDITIHGFMDNLFCATVYRLTNPRCDNANNGEALDILKWLLASGQSPDASIVTPRQLGSTVTPLQAAILCGNVDLVEQLLNAGANPNLTPSYGNTDSPLELALKMHGCGAAVVSRMAMLLLKHGTSVNLDQALHLAILRQDMDLAGAITLQGANLRGALKQDNGFVYEQTALSAAAAVGKQETQVILDFLASESPSTPMSSFITPDVMVSAAVEANNDVIQFLYDISPASVSANHYGITPLHVAARKGHLATCQLLLQLHGPLISTTGYLSPIHLASCGGHTDIVRLLVDSKADVNALATIGDTPEHKIAVERSRLNINTDREPCDLTALEALLEHASTPDRRWNVGHLACATILIQAGAQLTGYEVIIGARNRHPELLSAALSAGGSPNEQDPNGNTALQLALDLLHKQPEKTRRRGAVAAALLIEKGATLFGGEVTSAIYLGDWDLVKLLLSHGGSLSDCDKTGTTALEAGILSRNADSLYSILEAHTDVYDAGALCAAITAGMRSTIMHSVIDQLLSNRPSHASPDILEATAIGLAARLGDLSLLRKLLQSLPRSDVALLPIKMSRKGILAVSPNKGYWRTKHCVKGSPLALAVMGSVPEAYLELLSSGYQADKFTWTIVSDRNDIRTAQTLVDNNQRLDNISSHPVPPIHNPLTGPIKFCHKELLQLLLGAGADVNEHNRTLVNGRSPLQLAVELGDLTIVDCLLEARADVNIPPAFEGGGTALQLAAIKGHLGLANHLLDLGAQVAAPPAQKFGRTAIEGASEHGRLDMMELLLSHGALNTEVGHRQYLRSVQLATSEGHYAAVELLRGYWERSEKDERSSSEGDPMEGSSPKEDEPMLSAGEGSHDEVEGNGGVAHTVGGDSQTNEPAIDWDRAMAHLPHCFPDQEEEGRNTTEEGNAVDEMDFGWNDLLGPRRRRGPQ
ncbi:ankyrin repeat-containing domain protein [Ilyonectria robusta]|uniref:ankyrin repeat-containing domain protein n=1 Tax=Ilyonectria robusta TaxID=1079257 RepID=UPI001E8E20A5|nr:ankyrin repeat-containing domain protein [Ilyonectria robusta]KAH8736363.1 ankyrin repeat-containing domain protein [Ilyonectria robusta]